MNEARCFRAVLVSVHTLLVPEQPIGSSRSNVCRWVCVGSACAIIHTDNAAGEEVPARATCLQSLTALSFLTHPVLFSFTIFHHYHPSMQADDRSKNTMCDIDVMCVCLHVCFLNRGHLQTVLALEQGPLQAKCSKEQCKAPVSCPAGRWWLPYHPHWRGLGRVVMWPVNFRLSPSGPSFNGTVSMYCKRQTQNVKKKKEERNRQRYTWHIMIISFTVLWVLWA